MAKLSLRRGRLNPLTRELFREHRIHREQLVQPLFCVEGLASREPVAGMDGVFRDTRDSLLQQIESDLNAGINKFLLFSVPQQKGERDFSAEFGAARIHDVKRQFGDDLWLAMDVCLCSHTTHGHCGILDSAAARIVNDTTVAELGRIAMAYADAGVDAVAPSDMMDGRIAAIREALDGQGADATVLLSYAAKFQSSFYGPFRDAADSAPSEDAPLTDRASYQLDPARLLDARRCIERDVAEGADIVMVKPGLPYLDVLSDAAMRVDVPLAVYQTSGEQAMLDSAAVNGHIDAEAAQRETWLAFLRAGATIIISYAARRAAGILEPR